MNFDDLIINYRIKKILSGKFLECEIMPNEAVFRNSTIGGFNKIDVLTYIDKMNNKIHVMEKKQKLQINEFKKYVKNLENDLGTYNNQINILEDQMGLLKHKNDILNEKRKNLEANLFENKIKIEMLSNETSLEKEENRLLNEKNEKLREKSQKYDKIINQLGEIVLEAHVKAESIIMESKEQAEEITKASGTMLDFISLTFAEFTSEFEAVKKIVYKNSATIRDNLDSVEDSFVYEIEKFDEMKKKIDEKHQEILNLFSLNNNQDNEENIEIKNLSENFDEDVEINKIEKEMEFILDIDGDEKDIEIDEIQDNNNFSSETSEDSSDDVIKKKIVEISLEKAN